MSKKLTITTTHLLGNKEKKKIKNNYKDIEIFSNDKIYKFAKTKERISLLFEDQNCIFFSFDDTNYIPTIKFANTNDSLIKYSVFLDSGALKPICNGANVMAPGVFKYKDKIKGFFNKNDTVFIFIDATLVAVGKAEMSIHEIEKGTKGIAITVLHRLDDDIYTVSLN